MRRITSALLCCAMLSGCVSLGKPMTDFATDYNRMIADTRNKMILLNIVRASRREPTYYTAISEVQGSISYTGTSSVDVANLNGAGDSTFGGSVGIEFSSAPTFTIVPLNNMEFAKGLLQPISSTTIKLLLDQGWDPGLLAVLFIERIQCPGSPEPTINNPAKLRDFAQINIKIDVPSAASPGGSRAIPPLPAMRNGAKPPPYNFDLPAFPSSGRFVLGVDGSDAASLLAGGLDEKFEVKQLAFSDTGVVLDLQRTQEGELVFFLPESLKCSNSGNVRAMTQQSTRGAGASNDAVASIRSLDSVIYFLGELIRPDSPPSIFETLWKPNEPQTLFKVTTAPRGDAAITVKHRGQSYNVQFDDGGTAANAATGDSTLRIIALVNQLLALQTTTESLQRAPSTVRVR